MLFRFLSFVKRCLGRTKRPIERRIASESDRQEWERIRRERAAIERRLNYLEAQADVYARKDL